MDTNTLISSQLWEGNESRIFDLILEGKVELLISEDIIIEFEEVLSRQYFVGKLKDKELDLEGIKSNILGCATLVEPVEKVEVVKDDPEDNKILECALVKMPDFIISGDAHLLKLKNFKGVEIITSRKFLDIFEKEMKTSKEK